MFNDPEMKVEHKNKNKPHGGQIDNDLEGGQQQKMYYNINRLPMKYNRCVPVATKP